MAVAPKGGRWFDVDDAGLNQRAGELMFVTRLDLQPKLPLGLCRLTILRDQDQTVSRRLSDRKSFRCRIAIRNMPIHDNFDEVV